MASAALRHPIRVRLLETLSVREEVSATAFVNDRMGKGLAALRGRTHQQQVSDVGYHLRALEKADCVYLSREEKRRGVREKFYRAKAVAYFSDEEWASLELPERHEISRVVAQSLIVQIEGAMIADTFDSRTNRWLLWEPLDLDEQGWDEMTTRIESFYADVGQIHGDARKRLDDAGEGATPIRTTVGIVHFESPALPK